MDLFDLFIAIKMYKVLITLNVKMLEKSMSVTVNSTVYQNITVSTSWVNPVELLLSTQLFFEGI